MAPRKLLLSPAVVSNIKLLREHKLLDSFVQILLKASKEGLIVWSVPFHISFQIQFVDSLFVNVVVS